MNNNKILTIGAVFIIIVATFTGFCFVSEDADATATVNTNSDGYYTKIEGHICDENINRATLDVAIGCTVSIEFNGFGTRSLNYKPIVSGNDIGLTLGDGLKGTVTKAGTIFFTLDLIGSGVHVFYTTIVAHEPKPITGNFTDYKDTTVNATVGTSVDITYPGTANTAMRLYLSDSTCGLTVTNYDTSSSTDRNVSGTFTKAGTFTVSANHQGTSYGTITFVVSEAESKTYSHTVSYNSDGGSSVSDTVLTDSNSGSSSVTLASAPTKSGYTFNGWKIGSTVYAAGATVSVAADSTVTATAQWTENKITVNSPSTQYVVSGNTVKFTASASANTGSPTISYSVSSVPDGFTVTVSGSTVTVKCPTVTAIKDYTFTLTASASGYVSASTDVTVHMVPVLNFLNTPAAGIIIS